MCESIDVIYELLFIAEQVDYLKSRPTSFSVILFESCCVCCVTSYELHCSATRLPRAHLTSQCSSGQGLTVRNYLIGYNCVNGFHEIIINEIILTFGVRYLWCMRFLLSQIYIDCNVNLSHNKLKYIQSLNFVALLKRCFVRITQYCGFQNYVRVFL